METPDNLGVLLKDQEFSSKHLGDLSNLRILVSSGASLPITVFGDFADRIDLGICECYITSEAGVLASNPPEGERIGGTVGYALPNLDLRIMSPEGNILGPNEIGEIQVKGPMVFSGYWGRQNASDSAFTGDQFFHTGDVGFLAADGRLTLAGRVDDMISVGGKVVYPREIEVVLESLEGVKESVAIGLPHAELGEAVVVFVVSDDRAKRDYLHSALKQNIEAHKLPLDYVFVPDLPKSAVGTVQREQLRRKHAEMFTSKPGYPD
jgi:malonyl-CoA/methylmalonyl-CoA synthetase